MTQLKIISPEDVALSRTEAIDAPTLKGAEEIVNAVKEGGDSQLRALALKFGDVEEGGPLVLSRDDLKAAFDALPDADQALLQRTADRIRVFAEAQRSAVVDVAIPIPGGEAGHQVSPVEVAGCYAPGGRFPLPSSVLMTAVTARAAGVETVWLASPKPSEVTKAAAYVADADALLAVGGAQAIGAFAYGTETVPKCDVIVGPGNRWVTAAKKLVSGHVGIDMLAGPSELVVLADETADASVVAADLLAQAEHDVDAVPILVTDSMLFAERVQGQVAQQLEVLPTKGTAAAAVENGFAVVVESIQQGITICDQLAPEHLEVMTSDSLEVASQLNQFGGLFVGFNAAEVLGDYGAGPNHTLPTSGTARHTGGLSVFDFLRIRTWMRIDDLDDAQELVEDSIALAKHEGLEAHARSAAKRLTKSSDQ